MGGARKRIKRAAIRPAGAKLITRIQNALSLDLLHASYPPDERSYEEATRGHCYVATEAAYHLFGREAGFVPYVFNYGHRRGTHWWLKTRARGWCSIRPLPSSTAGPQSTRRADARRFSLSALPSAQQN